MSRESFGRVRSIRSSMAVLDHYPQSECSYPPRLFVGYQFTAVGCLDTFLNFLDLQGVKIRVFLDGMVVIP